MELKDAINKRRTVRDFKDQQIPEHTIEYAIENGFKAPTYNHLREWDIIIIDSPEQKLKIIEAEGLNKEMDKEALIEAFENEDSTKNKSEYEL